MSEDVNQVETELFGASEEPELNPEVESNTDDISEENQDTEESNDELDDADKAAKAKEQKEKQIAAWQRQVDGGEKSLEDAPEWIKKELTPKVREEDLDAKVERILAKKEADRAYEGFKTELRKADIDPDLRNEIAENFSDLVSDGISKIKALRVACKMAGLKDLKSYEKSQRYSAMALPKTGRRNSKSTRVEDMSDEDFMRLPSDKRVEFHAKKAGLL